MISYKKRGAEVRDRSSEVPQGEPCFSGQGFDEATPLLAHRLLPA